MYVRYSPERHLLSQSQLNVFVFSVNELVFFHFYPDSSYDPLFCQTEYEFHFGHT